MNVEKWNVGSEPELRHKRGWKIDRVLFWNRQTGQVIFASERTGKKGKTIIGAVSSCEDEFFVWCHDEWPTTPTISDLLVGASCVVCEDGEYETCIVE